MVNSRTVVTPGLARARVKAPLRQRLRLVSWGGPYLLRGPSFKGGPSMTETPCQQCSSIADFCSGSRAAVAGRLMAQPVYPQLRKCPERSGTYASCQKADITVVGRRGTGLLEIMMTPDTPIGS